MERRVRERKNARERRRRNRNKQRVNLQCSSRWSKMQKKIHTRYNSSFPMEEAFFS
jgi:hypothetical protein